MSLTIKHITISAKIPKYTAIGELSRKYPKILFNITNGHWISKDERILYITCKDWKKEYFLFLKKHKELIDINQIGNIIKIHIKSAFLRKRNDNSLSNNIKERNA